MIEKININELSERVENYGPYEWVDPKNICGTDVYKTKAENRKKWFGRFCETYESDDEKIADYLTDCLLDCEGLRMKENSSVYININGKMLVEAAICLICEYGSSYAGVHLSIWHNLINDKNAQECLDLLVSAYEKSEPFVKDILRDFILELYRIGSLWTSDNDCYEKILDKNSNDFLKRIVKEGYLTIDKRDARFFVNGSKRI